MERNSEKRLFPQQLHWQTLACIEYFDPNQPPTAIEVQIYLPVNFAGIARISLGNPAWSYLANEIDVGGIDFRIV